MWRVDDAITKYHPDVIYFDEHAGDSQVDMGVHMGLGFLAPPLVANYYNKSLQWNHGKMDVVVNLKGVGGRYNSFQNSPELLPFVDRSLVKSTEAIIESQIMAYPFQTETSIADWHYQTGQKYMDARSRHPFADAERLPQRHDAAQPHPARPRRSRSAGDSHLQRHRRLVESQRRSGLWVPPV